MPSREELKKEFGFSEDTLDWIFQEEKKSVWVK